MSDQDIQEFIDYLTTDWTAEDWENASSDELVYHVENWINQGGNIRNFFNAKFKFEAYMGW